ncbi:MAG TPA: CvpA family protein [Burkholderiales bacterium]|nr:CvpA family protein [Burkholderiales bacterium]
MTWFDYGVLIVLGLSLAMSLFHGLVRELISLAGWVAGFLLATFFGGQVAKHLPVSLEPLLSALIGFLLIFVGVLVVSWFISLVLSRIVVAAGLGAADRALGAVFGLVRGLVVVLVVVLLAGLTPLPREPFWRDAVLSGPFETVVLALRPFLPEGLVQRLKYR